MKNGRVGERRKRSVKVWIKFKLTMALAVPDSLPDIYNSIMGIELWVRDDD